VADVKGPLAPRLQAAGREVLLARERRGRFDEGKKLQEPAGRVTTLGGHLLQQRGQREPSAHGEAAVLDWGLLLQQRRLARH
jgi:hypothetical protein